MLHVDITVIGREAPTKIRAIVGIETTDMNTMMTLLTIDADGNKTYTMESLDEEQIIMLSTRPSLYKAIPYRAPQQLPARIKALRMRTPHARQSPIDFGIIGEYFEGFGDEVRRVVTETYGSVVDVMPVRLDVVVNWLQGGIQVPRGWGQAHHWRHNRRPRLHTRTIHRHRDACGGARAGIPRQVYRGHRTHNTFLQKPNTILGVVVVGDGDGNIPNPSKQCFRSIKHASTINICH